MNRHHALRLSAGTVALIAFAAGCASTNDRSAESMTAALADRGTTCCCAVSPPASDLRDMADVERDAILEALDDERYAEAFYAAVIDRHGSVRPFSNIINAERRHQQALLTLCDRYDIDVPPNRWADVPFELEGELPDLCAEAAQAEVQNAALYNRLLAAAESPDVRTVFVNLRDASQQRHLRAFRRCAARG